MLGSVLDHPANRGRRLRALARLAGSEVRARLTGRPVITRLGERSRIHAHLHAGGSWRVVRANPPDWPEMQAWRRQLSAGGLFVDVGAHAGVYTLWAIESGADAVAVEPNATMVGQLRANLALNGYAADVRAVALGAEPGRTRLAGPDLLRQHLSLDPATPGDGGPEVDVETLDDVLGDRSAQGVKIDVEGAERLVLEGARRALSEGRIALLQLEWNDCSVGLLGEDRRPVAALLEAHGYALFRPDEAGRLAPLADVGFGPDVFARRP